MQTTKEPTGPPEKFYAQITTVGGSEGIVIPREIIQANGWKKGTKLAIWIKKLEVKK